MPRVLKEEKLLEQLLNEDIEPMELYYSEIRDTGDNSVLGLRSKTVIRSLELGELDPEQYWPVANKSPSATAVFLWNLRQLCRDAMAIEAEALVMTKWLSVQTPISAIEELDFAEAIRAIFEEENFKAPSSICLEFPPPAIYLDKDLLFGAIQNIKSVGVNVILTGVGEVNYPMGRLFGSEAKYLYLSHTLSSGFLEGAKNLQVAEATVAYLKSLGFLVIAPRIEMDDSTGRRNAEGAGCVGYAPETSGWTSMKMIREAKERENK